MSVRSTQVPVYHWRPAALAESEFDFVEQRRAWDIPATSAMDLPEPTARGSPSANLSYGLFSTQSCRWEPAEIGQKQTQPITMCRTTVKAISNV